MIPNEQSWGDCSNKGSQWHGSNEESHCMFLCRNKEIMIISLNILFIPFDMDAGPRSAVRRHLTHESEVLGSIPGLATYFRFSFR